LMTICVESKTLETGRVEERILDENVCGRKDP
jgi:hypothetical protein